MIINLWSTPRTGSVWYSRYLAYQLPNSLVLSEIFNRYAMHVYYTDVDGQIFNHPTYKDGYFHKEFYLEDGNILSKRVPGPHTRTIFEEEEYRLDMLRKANKDVNYILHNHVEPINTDIRKHLLEIADENKFIFRKDKRAQLASYAIAYSTGKFATFKANAEEKGTVLDIDRQVLKELVRRIKIWDAMPKESSLAYEDIEFIDLPGMPMKQVPDYRTRISEEMLRVIEQLVLDYERN